MKEKSGLPCKIGKVNGFYYWYYHYQRRSFYHYFISNSPLYDGYHPEVVKEFNKTFGMNLKHGYCIDRCLDKFSFETNTEDLVNNYEI